MIILLSESDEQHNNFNKQIFQNRLIKKVRDKIYQILNVYTINKINMNIDLIQLYNLNEKAINRNIIKIKKRYQKNNKSFQKIIYSEKIKDIIKENLQDKDIIEKEKSLKYKEYYKILLNNVIKIILKKRDKKSEETNLYILAKEYHTYVSEFIYNNGIKYKTITIITDDVKYQKISDDMYNQNGINIIIANNKRRSINKAEYIINIDFVEEDLKKYNIYRKAIIFNIINIKIKRIKGFDGIIINNIEIEMPKTVLEKYKLLNNSIFKNFNIQDIYFECLEDINEVKSNAQICNFMGNNGNISDTEI